MKNLLSILSILISSVVYGVSPSDKVDVNNIDVEYLEGLVLEKINEYRVSKGLNSLELNKSEINYSRKHSEKMVKEEKLFHNLEPSEFPSPFLSIAVENCNNVVLNGSYEDIANKIVISWKYSPGHNQNLLNPNITLVEMGIVYTNTTVYGVENIDLIYTTYRGYGK
jgi:uncharacterized protein YkwD